MARRDFTIHPYEQHGYTRGRRGERKKKHPLYDAWTHMIGRCYHTSSKDYRYYGGRGITVCDRWRNSFLAFVEDVGERPGPGWSIDRIDNNGNYEPGNVRWASKTEQSRNNRNSKLTEDDVKFIRNVHIKGRTWLERGNTAELAQYMGVSQAMILRIARGDAWKP